MLILPIVGTALALLLQWGIIRAGVISGMRAHQLWLDQRERELARSADWSLANRSR
ncbi:MAG: hypothetical protein ABI566_02575 [Pseudolysinimonas sp.]